MIGDVAYFIHRVGPAGPQREANIENAKLWFRWLLDVTDLAIAAPWLAYVIACDEPTYRARGIRDGLTFASMTPIRVGIICGPEISRGCGDDRDTLLDKVVPIIDLTPMALERPPAEENRGLWRVSFERWVRLVTEPISIALCRGPAPILRVHGPGRTDLE